MVAESFYAAEVTPGTSQQQDGDQVYTLGEARSHSVGGLITHIWWYGADSPDATVPVGLYVGGVLVGSGTEASPVSGWQMTALSSPVAVDADEVFIPVTVVNRYVFTAGYFASEVTSGDFTSPANAGRLSTAESPPQSPTTEVATSYLVDVVLEPTEAATGTLAGTLPALIAALAGEATASGVLAGSLPALTAALVGHAGEATASGPRITSSSPTGRITTSTPRGRL